MVRSMLVLVVVAIISGINAFSFTYDAFNDFRNMRSGYESELKRQKKIKVDQAECDEFKAHLVEIEGKSIDELKLELAQGTEKFRDMTREQQIDAVMEFRSRLYEIEAKLYRKGFPIDHLLKDALVCLGLGDQLRKVFSQTANIKD